MSGEPEEARVEQTLSQPLGVPSIQERVVRRVTGKELGIVEPGRVAPTPSLAASQTPRDLACWGFIHPCKLLGYLS